MASEIELSPEERRRDVMSWLSRLGMVVGLTAAYGTLAGFMGRFLFPSSSATKGWMFVAPTRRLVAGEALLYRMPNGATVNIAKGVDGENAESFIALSSVCPHLGCQVHWQPQNNRFFCPCHNGTFSADGKATGGPPGEAGQSLPTYPLKVEDDLLFIETSLAEVAQGPGEILEIDGPVGAGHDPCLCVTRRV